MTDHIDQTHCTCGQVKHLLLQAMNGQDTKPCPVHRPELNESGLPIALNSAALTEGLGNHVTTL